MNALVTAILIIGGLIGAVFVYATVSKKLDEKTGKSLGSWFWSLVFSVIFLAVGFGGLSLVHGGMNDDEVGFVILGIIVMALASLVIYFIWCKDDSAGYDYSSRERTTHYNADNEITGYSDKD